MTTIEFFNQNDVEKFIDFMAIQNLDFSQDASGLIWHVEKHTADKIKEAHPFYDYWAINDAE